MVDVATPSSISAFLSQAQTLGLTTQNIYDCLKYAIVAGLSDDGRTVNIVNSDGVQVGVLSFDLAVAALRNLRILVSHENGPLYLAPEFSPFGDGSASATAY